MSLPLSSPRASTYGLSGVIAVLIESPEALQAWEKARQTLEAMGWVISRNGGHIALFENGEFEEDSKSGPALVLCKDRQQAKSLSICAPDAFTILQALGGGALEQALAESVGDAPPVDKVIIGLNWTMVRAGNLCGIARSPARGTEGARTIRPENGFAGKSLRELAAYLCSADALSRSLGLAAVNAYWNRQDPLEEIKPFLQAKGGFAAVTPPGDDLVIIGGFREVQKRLSNARIIEREPKPGDIAVADAPKAYREAKHLAITAQTLMNGSLGSILLDSAMVPMRSLVGPSAPLCPLIFDHGLDETCGLIVTDPEATEQFILESGTMIMLDHLTQSGCLRTPR